MFVSYAESSLTCKFELNTADFEVLKIRFDKSSAMKSGDTHKAQICLSSQMVRFVLVTLRVSLTCKFELNTAILDFGRFEVSKNPIFHNSYRRPQMVRFVLVTLRAF